MLVGIFFNHDNNRCNFIFLYAICLRASPPPLLFFIVSFLIYFFYFSCNYFSILFVSISFKRKGPWSVTFSYGRALQQSTLKAWAGKEANIGAAQKALLARAQANSEASLGKYVAGSQPSAGMYSYS